MARMQSKLTFNGINKYKDKEKSYTFKHTEILMDKPNFEHFFYWIYQNYWCMKRNLTIYSHVLEKKKI